jgi:hypothetical protein
MNPAHHGEPNSIQEVCVENLLERNADASARTWQLERNVEIPSRHGTVLV